MVPIVKKIDTQLAPLGLALGSFSRDDAAEIAKAQ